MRSIEIVQAFFLWMPWLPLLEVLAEGFQWHYTVQALGMAFELHLQKPINSTIPLSAETVSCFDQRASNGLSKLMAYWIIGDITRIRLGTS